MNSQGMTNSVGAPTPKACIRMENAARMIVNRVLSEEDPDNQEEHKEVSLAQTILSALGRLQSSLSTPSPDQQRDITAIRSAASSLIRMHGQESSNNRSSDLGNMFRSMDPSRMPPGIRPHEG